MIRKFGVDFPDGLSDIFIDLLCAKHWREEAYAAGNLEDPYTHLLRAASSLFTKDEWKISRWTEEHAFDFTTSNFTITWGCGASEKSNSYGLFVLLDWITDPTETLAIMASTTLNMLQLRSFESVIRYFRILKKHPQFLIPGKESKTRVAIINDDDPDAEGPSATVKSSIKGVAVKQGTLEEARAHLQGAHLPYTRLILDELSQMPEAAMEARHNLSLGAKDFRLFGLCNPDSLFDLSARYSEPLAGWDSVDRETSEHWETRWGTVRRHDGYRSPAIEHPKEYPYLINQTNIDSITKEMGGNTDAPIIWTQVRGWPPPEASEPTILTESMVVSYGMCKPVVWGPGPREIIQIAGLDPAFTADGDEAILQPATIGYEAVTGILAISFAPEIHIPLKATLPRPQVYQVIDYVLDWVEDHDFDLQYMGVDESGTQRVGDMLEVEYMRRHPEHAQVQVCRVNFGGRASEFPVSIRKNTPAREEYGNAVTELWYAMQEFGEHRQVRNLPAAAAEQFCQRRVKLRKPKVLEGKKDMKKRIKRSPDVADAGACALAVVRWVLQLVPGSTAMKPMGDPVVVKNPTFTLDMIRRFDIDCPHKTYLSSPL